MVVRITASRPKALALTARFSCAHPGARIESDDEGDLTIPGRVPAHVAFGREQPATYAPDAGMGFAAALHVTAPGGRIVPTSDCATVQDADDIVVLIAVATRYRGWRNPPAGPEDSVIGEARQLVRTAQQRRYDDLRDEHIADHQRLYQAAAVRFDGADESAGLPTDERVAAVRSGSPDPGLAALLFAYGRYLLIASSRPGTQPANLQGIRNREVAPPWDCDWPRTSMPR